MSELNLVKKQIEVNSTTTDKASVQLGQKYFDEFVKEKIKRLDDNGDEHKKVENNYFNNLIKEQINSLDDSSKSDNK